MSEAHLPTLEQWADALESGKYKQGSCYLKNLHTRSGTPEYCCHGVLLELAGAKDLGNECCSLNGVQIQNSIIHDLMPVFDQFRSENNCPELPDATVFAKWNDSELPEVHKSFKEIAGVIRQYAATRSPLPAN